MVVGKIYKILLKNTLCIIYIILVLFDNIGFKYFKTKYTYTNIKYLLIFYFKCISIIMYYIFTYKDF